MAVRPRAQASQELGERCFGGLDELGVELRRKLVSVFIIHRPQRRDHRAGLLLDQRSREAANAD